MAKSRKFKSFGQKLTYLAFCEKCNFPREIGKRTMRQLIKQHNLTHFYCTNEKCKHKNKLPHHILVLMDELIKEI
jgi:hypothetical protein